MRRTKSLIRQTRFVPCARIEDQLSEEISMSVETSSEHGARDQIDANAAGVLFLDRRIWHADQREWGSHG